MSVVAGLVLGSSGLQAVVVPCGLSVAGPTPFGGGSGFVGDPYLVGNQSQLAAITGDYLDCHFEQTADITLTGEWTPIGSEAKVFRGVYDSKLWRIFGLKMTGFNDYVGLFGVTDLAVVKNVSLIDVEVIGGRYVGGLIGSARGTSILNPRVSGTVSGALRVGGIAGDVINSPTNAATSELVAAFSDVIVSAAGTVLFSQFGGVAGFLEGTSVHLVKSTGAVSGPLDVGGAFGQIYGGALLSYVRTSGAVNGGNNVGGVVGTSYQARTVDSWSSGVVTATDADAVAGGVVGYVEGTTPAIGALVVLPDVEHTYAKGLVSGSGILGGVVGYLNPTGKVVESHWNKDANATINGIGLNESSPAITDPPGSTLTALQNITTFSGWTITNGWTTFNPATPVLWGICDGATTPFLLWEYTSSPCVSDWTVTGFFQPVKMDAPNVAKAGRKVPLKWRVLDGDGVPVSDRSSFVSVTSEETSCDGPSVTSHHKISHGRSALRYLGNGNWKFYWVTSKSFAGQCRTVTLTLSDGSTLSALFRFRR